MKRINFSENWNNKLDWKLFSTIRKESNLTEGDTVKVYLKKKFMFKAQVFFITSINFSSLPLSSLEFDTGLDQGKALKLFKKFGIEENGDATLIFLARVEE